MCFGSLLLQHLQKWVNDLSLKHYNAESDKEKGTEIILLFYTNHAPFIKFVSIKSRHIRGTLKAVRTQGHS